STCGRKYGHSYSGHTDQKTGDRCGRNPSGTKTGNKRGGHSGSRRTSRKTRIRGRILCRSNAGTGKTGIYLHGHGRCHPAWNDPGKRNSKENRNCIFAVSGRRRFRCGKSTACVRYRWNRRRTSRSSRKTLYPSGRPGTSANIKDNRRCRLGTGTVIIISFIFGDVFRCTGTRPRCYVCTLAASCEVCYNKESGKRNGGKRYDI